MELHAVKLFFSIERVLSGSAVISPATKGINYNDTTYSGGTEFAIQPNTTIASS
jgi:hypothetical protein